MHWRLQANAEGNLSERARARAAELAVDSEVRVTSPRETIQPKLVTSDVHCRAALDQRLPPSGSMLHGDYKGRLVRVLIVNNGFEYEGQLPSWPTTIGPTPRSSRLSLIRRALS